jgi:Lon-like ATP-dependent protease
VRTIDEGIELLTGVLAGERGPDGAYPVEAVNGRVDRKLRELAERLQSFGQKSKENQDKERKNGEPEPAPEEPSPGEPDLPGDLPRPMEG